MGEIPGWIKEQLQDEGWVVVESLETFDVHLGDRYASRATALQKALAGDALLASRGTASLSRDLEGEFVVGRLRRSAQSGHGCKCQLSQRSRLHWALLCGDWRANQPNQ